MWPLATHPAGVHTEVFVDRVRLGLQFGAPSSGRRSLLA